MVRMVEDMTEQEVEDSIARILVVLQRLTQEIDNIQRKIRVLENKTREFHS